MSRTEPVGNVKKKPATKKWYTPPVITPSQPSKPKRRKKKKVPPTIGKKEVSFHLPIKKVLPKDKKERLKLGKDERVWGERHKIKKPGEPKAPVNVGTEVPKKKKK